MYVRERRDLDVGGRKICVVLAKSSSVSQCPEKKGVIRVKDYKQSLAMESDGSGGTKGTNTRLMMSSASLELRRTTDCVNQMLHSVHQQCYYTDPKTLLRLILLYKTDERAEQK